MHVWIVFWWTLKYSYVLWLQLLLSCIKEHKKCAVNSVRGEIYVCYYLSENVLTLHMGKHPALINMGLFKFYILLHSIFGTYIKTATCYDNTKQLKEIRNTKKGSLKKEVKQSDIQTQCLPKYTAAHRNVFRSNCSEISAAQCFSPFVSVIRLAFLLIQPKNINFEMMATPWVQCCSHTHSAIMSLGHLNIN